MRLGIVVYGDLSQGSGGYLYDRKLVEFLRHRGHAVEVVSIPRRSYGSNLSDNISPSLYAKLRNLPVDILLQDELNHPSLFLLNKQLKQVASYPIISIVHHLRSTEGHPAITNWIYRRIEDRYLNSVDGFIFNGHVTQRVVEMRLATRVPFVVATPGGDRWPKLPSAKQVSARSQRPGPLHVLFLGNLIRRKKPQVLVEAAARLKGLVLLKFVGRMDAEPKTTTELHDLVRRRGLADQVNFHGELGEQDLAKVLRSSQVLALPSFYEGFGIVYLEGMGFGLPAIATTAGGAKEIIKNGHNGYLIEPDSVSQLEVRLGELAENRNLLEKLSLEALATFESFPGWETSLTTIETFLSSYNSLTSSTHKPRRKL